MTEIIRCPGCSTRFALRAERVRPGLRRAKCFKCETVFEIHEEVERLLAPVPEAPAADLNATTPIQIHPPAAPEPEVPVLVAAALPGDTVNLDAEPPSITETLAIPVSEPSPFEAFETFEAAAPPSLTLGDLEGADEEIMEKTLVILPPAEAAEAPEEASASGFTSAKDAIAKLMGDAPAPPASPERRMLGTRNPMDVEATLSALEDTLSGVQAPAQGDFPPAAASTLKLSAQEIQAAIRQAPTRLPDIPAQAAAPLVAPPVSRPLPPPPMPPAIAQPTPGADLLKVQLEQETMENLTIDQITRMVELGRVHDYHMVARQFSDNWIEANKVPALRPVFERRRREEIGLNVESANPPEMAPPKRSLFGGLFGRN